MNFVTGATGLVGMRIMFDLLTQGKRVKGFKRSSSDLKLVKKAFDFYGDINLFDAIVWAEGDVLDVFSLQDAMVDCKTVYHAAALVSFHRKDKDDLMRINVQGTANVVNVALDLGIEKMCYISSTAAIGRIDSGETITESNEWKESPLNSNYAISKYNAELEVWRGIEEGLNCVIVNPSVIIGEGRGGKSSAQLFGKNIPFYPSGINGYVSVKDVSEICLKLMEKEIFASRFILSSENITYKDLFYNLSLSMGNKPPTKQAKKWMISLGWFFEGLKEAITGRRAEITKETVRSTGNVCYYDSSKIQKTLNFSFEPILEVIKRTGDFYK